MRPHLVADAVRDVRFAYRQWRRTPGLATLIVVTLATGIGANATMFGAVERLLLSPPPHVAQPERVSRVLFVTDNPSGARYVVSATNMPTLLDLAREAASFEAVAGFANLSLSLDTGPDAIELRASVVTPSFFRVLGVTPVLGRVFGTNDGFPTGEAEGGPPLAVLSYGLWQRRFGGDRAVVGRTMRLGGIMYTVVGVLPAGFRGVDAEPPDVWVPASVAAAAEAPRLWFAGRGATWLSLVALLRPQATREMASQQATAVWMASAPGSRDESSRTRVAVASVIPGRGPDMPRQTKVVLWLGAVSALVLLIACANVANLLLGRAFARRREIAVRLALGASSGRLARQMLAEAFVLSVLSGAAAAYVAYLGGVGLDQLLVGSNDGTGWFNVRQLLFTGAVALGTGVLISLAPLSQSRSTDLAVALHSGATVSGGRTSRVRAALLVTQAAVSMLLLCGAVLFAESLRHVEGLDLGVDRDRTLMVQFDLRRFALPRPEVEALYDEITRRVRAVPGVRDVAWAEHDPSWNGRAVGAHTTAHEWEYYWHSGIMTVPMQSSVGEGYFRTVGASVRGRDFAASDDAGAPAVAIINGRLAALLWPGQEAVGQCMLTSDDPSDRNCVTIVGVVPGFFKRGILDRDQYVVYRPLAQGDAHRPAAMFIAVQGEMTTVVPAVRRAFQSARTDLPAVSVERMRDVLEPEMKPWRLAATMFTAFGSIALIIAVVGLYGVVATNATLRSMELAVRIALGAQEKHILVAVAGDGLRSVAVGLAIGSGAALVIGRWLGGMLYETSASDPAIILGVAALLFSVAVIACLVPTWRVLRTGPAIVLRSE